MARMPVLPTSSADPTGMDRKERGAINEFSRRINLIHRGLVRILNNQEYVVVTINSREMHVNEEVYRYELNETVLANINAEIAMLIDSILLEGGQESLWFLVAFAEPAYRNGTAQSWTNLTVQSEAYALSRPTLESILLSPPYRTRIGLLKAREFEVMKNLTDTMKSDLGSTLARGMTDGKSPRAIAKDIEARIGVSKSRANLIARTEIGYSFRKARMDEDDQAREDLGVRTMQLHISALSPTTRPNHRARHGNLYTTQQQREFWSTARETCNCRCSTVAVLVDENNEPLTPSIIERAKRKLK